MLKKEFEAVENVKDFVTRSRPMFVEKHDISANLFRNRETGEPCLSFSSRGERHFDLYRIATGLILIFVWTLSVRIYFGVRKARRNRKKELKRIAREKKQAAKK